MIVFWLLLPKSYSGNRDRVRAISLCNWKIVIKAAGFGGKIRPDNTVSLSFQLSSLSTSSLFYIPFFFYN